MNTKTPSLHRSLVISMAERYSLIALALGSSIVIARLLTPAEIGIYAIATALIGIAQVVRDFGIGSYLVQERELTRDHIASAFGVSLFIGALFFVAFTLSAPLVGEFYRESRVIPIVRIVAFNFLLLPFCSISLSLLRRDMQFGRIMAANAAGSVSGVAVMLYLAFAGMGPASLAWGSLMTNAVTGIVAFASRRDRTLLRPSLAHWRTIFRFGRQSTAAAVVTSIAMDVNDLVVGKVLGFTAVAMLSRAQALMMMFHRDIMTAIRGVAFPAFAQSHRRGDVMGPKYVLTMTNVTVFAWPFYGLAALFPLEIMRLLFGPQWDEAASLVPIFCLAGAVAATFSMINPFMVAVGRNDLVTRAELVVQPLRVALVAAAAIAYRSLIACAIAFLVAFVIAAPVFYHYVRVSTPISRKSIARGLWTSLRVSAIALLPAALIANHFGLDRSQPMPLPMLAIAVGISAFIWLAATLLLRHPISDDLLFRRLTTAIFSTRRR